MLIHLVAAARPNFMKIAPLYHSLKEEKWAETMVVHTGQHYDLDMSDAFFKDLDLPEPDLHLGVGSGTHAEQTGYVMTGYEKVLTQKAPDLTVVVGDVNSTMAATLVAAKLGLKVAHLEAGLRSFDRRMPEEINRIVTDALSDILWTPSPDADESLLREGVAPQKIIRVGNIMIDSLEMLREKIERRRVYEEFGLESGRFGLVTLHRPSNVDNPDTLVALCRLLARIGSILPLVFPVHPRTRKNLEKDGLMTRLEKEPQLLIIKPLNYIRFMNLLFHCRFALTDSGGIQEETTYLGIPCLTLRPNTERPITVLQGTNRLCTLENLENHVGNILSGRLPRGRVPEYWDGRTAERVVKSIKTLAFN